MIVVLVAGLYHEEYPSLYERNLLGPDSAYTLSGRAYDYEEDLFLPLHARNADPDDDLTQQELALQQQLQKAAHDPAQAQRIQQKMLDLMKQHQADRGPKQRRRSVRPLTPSQQIQQMAAQENRMIAQARLRDQRAQQKALALTPGAGVTQMTIIPGRVFAGSVGRRAVRLQERLALAESEADGQGFDVSL